MDTLRFRLEGEADQLEGGFTTRHGTLRLPARSRRFWTPCLELTIDRVEPDGDDDPSSGERRGPTRTRLWGTFSPRAEIWTAFVFAIGTCVVVSVFGGVYGLAQLALGQAPTGLLVPVGGVVIAAGLYLVALIGQGLSLAEMYRMRTFVDVCLREVAEGRPRVQIRPPIIREGAGEVSRLRVDRGPPGSRRGPAR